MRENRLAGVFVMACGIAAIASACATGGGDDNGDQGAADSGVADSGVIETSAEATPDTSAARDSSAPAQDSAAAQDSGSTVEDASADHEASAPVDSGSPPDTGAPVTDSGSSGACGSDAIYLVEALAALKSGNFTVCPSGACASATQCCYNKLDVCVAE